MVRPYIKLLRPSHWVKNGLLFGGLIFGGQALNRHALLDSLLAFGTFCALASFVYVINDMRDKDSDRAHPLKRFRPIASGEISLGVASIIAVALALISALGAYHFGRLFAIISVGYVVNSVLYSLLLKRFVIVDVMIIAVGFVLRAWAGSAAIGVHFDSGLFILTFLLALFLGFGKRRHELLLLNKDDASTHRVSLDSYSAPLLDQLITIVTAAVVITYIMFVISPDIQAKLHSVYLWTTTPFVFYGVFRYLYLVHMKERGGSPTRLLLTDWPLLLDVILWLVAIILLLYPV